MRTSKIFVGFATITLLVTTMSIYSASAAMWNGSNHGQGRMWWNYGSENTTRMTHNESLALSGITTAPLSNQEKLDLAYQYSEEMVARDTYNYFYSLYKLPTFQNIAASEQEHMNAVKTLLERYSLLIPTGYGELTTTFTSLKAEWEKWVKEALEVGIKIEMLDIKDIIDTIKTTDNDDIKIVLTNIWGASYNHMRGFLQGLTNNGFTTSINYSEYLNQTDLNSRWSLQSKLSEKLVAEKVVLPTQTKKWYKQDTQWNYGKKMEKMPNSQLSPSTINEDKVQPFIPEIKEQKIPWYMSIKEYINSFFR